MNKNNMALNSVFRKQKKGNVFLDGIFYFVAVIVFIVIVVSGSYVLNQVNTDVQSDVDMSNESKTSLNNLNNDLPSWFDYGVGTVILLLWILVVIASFRIDSHPVFFFISVIVLAIAIFAVNSFMLGIDDYFADPDIAPIVLLFPISSFITTNIEIFIALVGFSILLALYAKEPQ